MKPKKADVWWNTQRRIFQQSILPCVNYWSHRDKNGDNCKSIFNQGHSLSLLMREKICLHCYCTGNSLFICAQVCHTYRKWQMGKPILFHLFWIIDRFGVPGRLFPLCHLKTVMIFVFHFSSWEVLSLTEIFFFQRLKGFEKNLTFQMDFEYPKMDNFSWLFR